MLFLPQAQVRAQPHPQAQRPPVTAPPPSGQVVHVATGGGLYPSLEDYMGLDIKHYTPVCFFN